MPPETHARDATLNPAQRLPAPHSEHDEDINIYNRLDRSPSSWQAPETLVQSRSPYDEITVAAGPSGQIGFPMSMIFERRSVSCGETQDAVSPNIRTGAVLTPPPPNGVIRLQSTDSCPSPEILLTNRTSNVTPHKSMSKEERFSEDEQRSSTFGASGMCDGPSFSADTTYRQQPNSHVLPKVPEELRLSDSGLMCSTAEASEQCDSNMSVRPKRDSCDSTILDPDGYVPCIP